jgi:hypothetical protein
LSRKGRTVASVAGLEISSMEGVTAAVGVFVARGVAFDISRPASSALERVATSAVVDEGSTEGFIWLSGKARAGASIA